MRPTPGQVRWLSICSAASADVPDAWNRWRRAVGDPRAELARDPHHLRAQLPLVARRLADAGVRVPRDLASILRAADLREQLRYNTIRRVTLESHDALSGVGITPVLMGSIAAAQTTLDDPYLRHCAGPNWVVPPGRVDDALAAVAAGPWRVESNWSSLGRRSAYLTHSSGLRMALSDVPLPFGPCVLAYDDVLVRSRERDGLQLADPVDLLLGCTASLLRDGVWKRQGELLDARAIAGRLDDRQWTTLAELAGRNRLAGPLAAVLWSSRRPGLRVAESVRASLQASAASDAVGRRLIAAAEQACFARGPAEAFRHAWGVGSACRLLRPAGGAVAGRAWSLWRPIRQWLAHQPWAGGPYRAIKRVALRVIA